jgi:hypothetical protein
VQVLAGMLVADLLPAWCLAVVYLAELAPLQLVAFLPCYLLLLLSCLLPSAYLAACFNSVNL